MTILLLILSIGSLLLWTAMRIARRGSLKFVFNAADPVTKVCDAGERWEDPKEREGGWPAVTVIVPGRNEGHVLRETLGSVCAMKYPNFRVVFIDDQSADNTPAVCEELKARFPNLTVIRNETPPEKGWVGKVWAVHQAQTHATTDYLMFCDSDLVFHPEALTQAMRVALCKKTDLMSVLPRMLVKSVGELLGIFAGILLITTAIPLRVANDPKSKKALAAGGFSLYRREAYEKIGGHEAVRTQVIEDIALCTRLKAAGLKAFTVMTHDLYEGRMYDGWRDTYRGLKKNAFAGAHYSYALAVAYALMMLAGLILTPVYAGLGIYYWVTHPSILTFAACVTALAAVWMMVSVGLRDTRLLKLPPSVAWIAPVALLFYLGIFLGSVLDHARGGTTWAGRKMAAKELGTLREMEKR